MSDLALPFLTAAVTDKLVNFATNLIGDAGYAGVFVLMTLESALIPIPSEATMLFAGFKVEDGDADPVRDRCRRCPRQPGGLMDRLRDRLLRPPGAASSATGSFTRTGSYLEWADNWFTRHGDATVFFSRMIAVIRTFISLPAGVARMPFWRFTLLTIAGCIPWVFGLALLGREVGSKWEDWKDRLHYLDYAVLAAIVALIAYALWKRRRGRVEPATES